MQPEKVGRVNLCGSDLEMPELYGEILFSVFCFRFSLIHRNSFGSTLGQERLVDPLSLKEGEKFRGSKWEDAGKSEFRSCLEISDIN